MQQDTCKVTECERADIVLKSGLCRPHQNRLQRDGQLGSPTIPKRTRRSTSPQCAAPDCDRRGTCRGLCRMHRYRATSNGDPLVTRPPGAPMGDDHPLFKADDIGYQSAHARVARRRGKAKMHACQHCGLAAQHWAVIHERATLRDAELGLSYSANPDDYVPLCVPCHSAYDRERIEILVATPA